MRRISLVLILIFTFSTLLFAQSSDSAEAEDTPQCFETDGCTLFPDGNYRDCCVDHDKDYFKGGTRKERSASDKRLYRCVKRKKGWKSKVAAPVMWLGVRVFGSSFFPTPFRWGFGKRKKYKKCLMKIADAKKAEAEKVKEDSRKPAEN